MLIQASAFELPYPDKLFHAVVTSPPYWGLRKYSGNQGDEPLGLEATPERHIERMVQVFREVRRVLRDDGVLWLNYGDCFDDANLMLMPHRLAIALQDDGWMVRNDLVWYKRNPMPESVAGWRWERNRVKTRAQGEVENHQRSQHGGNPSPPHPDNGIIRQAAEYEYGDDYVLRKSSWRHTRAHEYVFQLVKGMGYYCNQEVVRERQSELTLKTHGKRPVQSRDGSEIRSKDGGIIKSLTNNILPSGRNPRSVLDVPTAPYKGAHYATFPPKLIAPLIRASVPRRCCPVCGMAWAPVVERTNMVIARSDRQAKSGNRTDPSGTMVEPAHSNVTAYRPTCDHEHTQDEAVPGIVLDIFGGSGTTGMVAKSLLRRWVVMDISHPYLDEQAKVRTGSGSPANALDGLPMFEEA